MTNLQTQIMVLLLTFTFFFSHALRHGKYLNVCIKINNFLYVNFINIKHDIFSIICYNKLFIFKRKISFFFMIYI